MWESLLKVLLGFLKTWYDGERKEALEWESKALKGQQDSMKEARVVEKMLEAARHLKTPSAQEWNRKAVPAILPLLVLVLLSGCSLFTKYVTVPGMWPEFPAVERPQIPGPEEWGVREAILAGYASALEAQIAAYNGAAKAHNLKYGYTDPQKEESNVGEDREGRTPSP
ncbi:MAG: hypothetical protein EHM14_15955 [Methanothrix sp.]|nr:MAG: hypothetical protein EHM14_15955 [Methanothrix sp.]